MTWTTLPRSEGAAGLSCHVTGQGPLMILLHGVGLRSEAWGAMIPVLAPHFRLVAVDLPGHGQSAPLPTDAPELYDFTDRIAQFLQPFGRPAAVVGHSMGAMIALDLAIRHPEMVSSVTALNAIFQRDPTAREAVLARAQTLSQDEVADPTGTLDRWFGSAPEGWSLHARNACKVWLETSNPSGYACAYRVFAAHDGPAPEDLGRLQCPALFITGGNEPNSTPAMSRMMADLAPRGAAHIIDGAAHMAPMTHGETIARLILDGLDVKDAA